MADPTVEEVLNLSENQPTKKPSLMGPVVAFFLLPPLGVYLLWKEKTFHFAFAVLSVVAGVGALTALPSLSILSNYFALGSQTNSFYFIILVSLTLVQIVVSAYFAYLAKKNSYLENYQLNILAVFVLLVDLVISPILFGATLFKLFQSLFQQNFNLYKGF